MMAIIVIFIGISLFYGQKIVYRKFWNKNLTYSIEFSSPRVYEGSFIWIEENVRNAKILPIPFLNARYTLPYYLMFVDSEGKPLNYGEDRDSLFTVPMKKSITKRTKYHCGRRGYYKIKNVELMSSDILFSGYNRLNMDNQCSLTVYPDIADRDCFSVPFDRIMGSVPVKKFTNPDPFEFAGIREYQPYDNFKQINFNASARTGALMSNVYGHTVSQSIVIVLNLESYNQFDRGGVMEKAIRLAAFFSKEFIEMGIGVEFISTATDSVTSQSVRLMAGASENHFLDILGVLARVDYNISGENFNDVVPEIISDSSSVILISSKHKGEVFEWFEKQNSMGTNINWVIPKCPKDSVNLVERENIIHWEVENELR